MIAIKSQILENLCYTELVYGRINKKLKTNFSKREIGDLISGIIKQSEERNISRIGKNYYIDDDSAGIRITVNSNTFRVITVDKI